MRKRIVYAEFIVALGLGFAIACMVGNISPKLDGTRFAASSPLHQVVPIWKREVVVAGSERR
jgi:hypothetical protein